MSNPDQRLKINEVARRLNCSHVNVRSLIAKGLLAVIRTGATGKGFRVEASEVERFIADRRTVAGPHGRRMEPMVKLKHLKLRDGS